MLESLNPSFDCKPEALVSQPGCGTGSRLELQALQGLVRDVDEEASQSNYVIFSENRQSSFKRFDGILC